MNCKTNLTSPKRYWSLILLILAVFFVSGCDLLIPAPTPLPTATSTQTETPTPTIDWFPATLTSTAEPDASPTLLPTLVDMREGITELLINDTFIDQNLWSVSQGTPGNIAFGTENLTLAVARPSTVLSSVSQHDLPANIYLEITVQAMLCQPSDQIGLIFMRESAGDFYRLLLSCSGQYRLEVSQGGQVTVIQDWETAARMQPGIQAANRVGLWIDRGDFQLYINDTFQFSRRIVRDRGGGLGVFARTINGDAMTVRFSDLQVYRIEAD